MIDVNKNALIILPKEHIAFRDIDYAIGVDKKNKVLEELILGVIGAGTLLLIYYVIKNANERHKRQN